MDRPQALGDFIHGEFHAPTGDPLTSRNPVNGKPVLETRTSPSRMAEACDAAHRSLNAWRQLKQEDRWNRLVVFRDHIAQRRDHIATAITSEMGKLHSEAHTEVTALINRFDLVHQQVHRDLRDYQPPGVNDEYVHHMPHGVVGVIGPFNFPLHLCHAHVVPALLLGNTVVLKPSEVTPWCGELYAQAAQAAKLPPGVLNVVNGGAASGAALLGHRALRALCFTGSWATGRRILESLLDRPEVLVALEMGGKNAVVVCSDADLAQAAHEIIVGGHLTTGQRCTCTDRVLVHRTQRDALVQRLADVVKHLRYGDPYDGRVFGGPLATEAAHARYEQTVHRGEASGAERIATGHAPDTGAFAPPLLHLLPEGAHSIEGYTDTEIFGPDVHVEVFDDDDEAMDRLDRSSYGLSHSVFTGQHARFLRYQGANAAGVLNWNRGTNQASPRLPFGGTKRSGNFRPAGAYAPRNLAIPVGVRSAPLGAFVSHPLLKDVVTGPDLEVLDARHTREEALDASRLQANDQRRRTHTSLPADGSLPQSSEWLERLYAGAGVVREKKPGVFDHCRSVGPWFVSVDDHPLSVIDGMSQTSTMPFGFSADPVVRHFVEQGFGDTVWTADDSTAQTQRIKDKYAHLLRAATGLPEITWTNSGSEACEKALALCKANAERPTQSKVLAFEGSFHGRTLLSLHASHNPAKRTPFEFRGHEVTFAPFPVWRAPNDVEPGLPPRWTTAFTTGNFRAIGTIRNALMLRELEALSFIHRELSGGNYYAVIVEPMQSEGGDRYATARFFKCLRMLTRKHRVPLIMDEVQCGLGLGGSFCWHERFILSSDRGQPDLPDCITFAKRAQVGAVASRFADLEPTPIHPASLLRGYVHAQALLDDSWVDPIEVRLSARLFDVADRFPELVKNPRVTGYAMAFDLPSPELLKAFIAQRFWRGAIVFPAGTSTVRYRLNASFGPREIDRLVEAIRKTLAWLDAHHGTHPPAWENLPQDVQAPPSSVHDAVEVKPFDGPDAAAVITSIMALEEEVYEPARRDPVSRIRLAFEDPDGVAIVAADKTGKLVGYALGFPLERTHEVDGVQQDAFFGSDNTVYCSALTVHPDHRGQHLGKTLRAHFLNEARQKARPDGTPRYRFASGRNRVGHADAMRNINRQFGAHVVFTLTGQYNEKTGKAEYYRIPLQRPVPASPTTQTLHTASVQNPLRNPPQSLIQVAQSGQLNGPLVNKITMCNYTTPAAVRAYEWVQALVPHLPHLYTTSCRDEAFDKTVRLLRHQRPGAQIVMGTAGIYVGHTVASARSLSDPKLHSGAPPVFSSWPRVPHLGDQEPERWLQSALNTVEDHGGADNILGLFVEPLQERTGRILTGTHGGMLRTLRVRTGIPIVFVETAGAYYRSGNGPFTSSSMEVQPDALLWWAGGQLGFVHVSRDLFVNKPLAFISTWDGDELCLIRTHHQLRAIRKIHRAASSGPIIPEVIEKLRTAGIEARGQHAHWVLGETAVNAATLGQICHDHGLSPVRQGPVTTLSLPLDNL